MIRRILPKGMDLTAYQQEQIDLMMSHINSYLYRAYQLKIEVFIAIPVMLEVTASNWNFVLQSTCPILIADAGENLIHLSSIESPSHFSQS